MHHFEDTTCLLKARPVTVSDMKSRLRGHAINYETHTVTRTISFSLLI